MLEANIKTTHEWSNTYYNLKFQLPLGVPHFALKDVVIEGYTIPKGASVIFDERSKRIQKS